MSNYLVPLLSKSPSRHVGTKAENLRLLARRGFRVPTGWVCRWDAYAKQRAGDPSVIHALKKELAACLREEAVYAVRSSANIEDASVSSFAGQFRSVLGVQGVEAVLKAIESVWDSADTPEVSAYLEQQDRAGAGVLMAVILQEMVPALWSGIAFSKNPVTGLSEIIVEAGPGAGPEAVQGARSPERWISKWGRWQERPTNPGLEEAIAGQLVRETIRIARRFGYAVDAEWAFDGINIHWVQVRAITRTDVPIYSNKISKEMLPGIIKPLVYSVNTRQINALWTGLLTKLTGDRSLRPEDMTGHFYYRAYFNMALFGRVFERLGMPYEALELLMGLEAEGPDKPGMKPGPGVLPRLPAFVSLAVSLLTIESRLQRVLHTREPVFRAIAEEMALPRERTPTQWMDLADRITRELEPVTRMNILAPLLGMMYSRLRDRTLEKAGVDPRRLDHPEVRAAADSYRPHAHIERLRRLHHAAGESPDEYKRAFDDFIERFGHFSDSGNDFSSVPWRETPELIVQMIEQSDGEPAGGALPSAGSDLIDISSLQLPRFRRGSIRWLHRRAEQFAAYREAISSLYTYTYGQYRTCFLSLGALWVKQGVFDRADDLFYLYLDEVQRLAAGASPQPTPLSPREEVARRRAEIETYRHIPLPETIFGNIAPPISESSPGALHGLATSLGFYEGPARVLYSLSDFPRLLSGDVLVIPYSDVGWTPLFGRAGAVVAESGGMLSHSSIMAREHRIPAVVSVPDACLIPDGTWISVNGHTGEIRIGKKEETT